MRCPLATCSELAVTRHLHSVSAAAVGPIAGVPCDEATAQGFWEIFGSQGLGPASFQASTLCILLLLSWGMCGVLKAWAAAASLSCPPGSVWLGCLQMRLLEPGYFCPAAGCCAHVLPVPCLPPDATGISVLPACVCTLLRRKRRRRASHFLSQSACCCPTEFPASRRS